MTDHISIASDDARHIADVLDKLEEVNEALSKIETYIEFPIRVQSEIQGFDGVIAMHDSGALVFKPGVSS
ncbi:hypothetical protein [Gordonia alkanivorans]|uniref:Uncharacterized protein n=2 Tax=root TaxID=1 RepID=A0A159B6G1_9CAUD|nr:hypothetical protein [Gordonia alkanivorans]YP_009324462.1 hypothetical protein BOX05_gp70 [Gordonia phage GAL1]AKJ72085.1 hypothetical protein GAL1_70 [Gordonia phage GAL1]GAA13855.1 hypothetical protein GOALK_093_00430 [Gordonia alkanivorans NBRC 16433]